METTNMKVCKKCGRELPLSQFGINRSRPDGRQYYCRDCYNAIARENYRLLKQDTPLRAAKERMRRERAMARAAHCTITEKRCGHCGRVLPLDQFYANSYSSDGKASACKDCMKEFSRKQYLKIKESRDVNT